MTPAPPGMEGLAPIPDESDEGKAWGEVKVGLRCAGCGERIVKGYKFLRVQVVKDPLGSGERAVMRSETIACVREECDYVLKCAADATAVKKIDNEWLFLDDERIAGIFRNAASN